MIKTKRIIALLCSAAIIVLLLGTEALSLPKGPSKDRKEALDLYTLGEYAAAKEKLLRLITDDLKAEQITDYYMLADIFIRSGETDSAKKMLDLAWQRTETSKDSLLIKRNQEFLTALKEQLKYQIEYLKIPKLKTLESYLPPPAPAAKDTTKLSAAPDSSVKDTTKAFAQTVSDTAKVDSVLAAEKQKPPEIPVPGARPKIAGGAMAVMEYITMNNIFPQSAMEAGIEEGVVLVEVTVDTAGLPIGMNIVRAEPAEMGFERAALEVLENMQYIPAESDSGKTVGKLTQPVMFRKPQ